MLDLQNLLWNTTIFFRHQTWPCQCIIVSLQLAKPHLSQLREWCLLGDQTYSGCGCFESNGFIIWDWMFVLGLTMYKPFKPWMARWAISQLHSSWTWVHTKIYCLPSPVQDSILCSLMWAILCSLIVSWSVYNSLFWFFNSSIPSNPFFSTSHRQTFKGTKFHRSWRFAHLQFYSI